MEPTDCQKQLERISAQILVLDTRAKQSQIKGIPFCESSRLEYYEYLRDNLERTCYSANTKSIIPMQVYPPIVQKYP